MTLNSTKTVLVGALLTSLALFGLGSVSGKFEKDEAVRTTKQPGDISRFEVELFRSPGGHFNLRASISPDSTIVLRAKQWVSHNEYMTRISTTEITLDEWSELLQVVRQTDLIRWQTSTDPEWVPHVDGGSTSFLLGGDDWLVQYKSSNPAFPGGTELIRTGRILFRLSNKYSLTEDWENPLWSTVQLEESFAARASMQDAGKPVTAKDISVLVVGAVPAYSDPTVYPPLGDFVVVFFRYDEMRVGQRHHADSLYQTGDQHPISVSEREAFLEVLMSDRLIELAPHATGTSTTLESEVSYVLKFQGQGWVRTVMLPRTQAEPMATLMTFMHQVAVDRSAWELPYFDEAVRRLSENE